MGDEGARSLLGWNQVTSPQHHARDVDPPRQAARRLFMFDRLNSHAALHAAKRRFLMDAETQALACTWPRHVQQRTLALTRMLKPYGLVSARKIRVGGDGDGGYVMVDDFKDVETVFSLGVGPNVDWDYEIAERGLPVHQFDHTVNESPRGSPALSVQLTSP